MNEHDYQNLNGSAPPQLKKIKISIAALAFFVVLTFGLAVFMHPSYDNSALEDQIASLSAQVEELEASLSGRVEELEDAGRLQASHLEQVLLEQLSIEVLTAWDYAKNIRDGALAKTATEDVVLRIIDLDQQVTDFSGYENITAFWDTFAELYDFQITFLDLMGVWNPDPRGTIRVNYGFQLTQTNETEGVLTQTLGECVAEFESSQSAITGMTTFLANRLEFTARVSEARPLQ